MTMSDTISDMLTRIRNSLMAKKSEVILPYSNFKNSLAKVLQTEGWIAKVETKETDGIKSLVLQLKYDNAGLPVISGIKRVSKPGQRIYSSREQIPTVLGGMGTTIISTSKGLMTDKEARKNKVGGEVVCQVW
ncbi:MAG: 30S ribosomal protein S8 [Candidatus Doudnabacteria bacterium]|nr:30S ribosomal protein S8 [Candidatus Doudnabacteria bacterium]